MIDMGFKFKPSRQGFIDLRNEGFIQKACLSKAKDIASTAGGFSGTAYQCDVQPGKTRCHARASARVSKDEMSKKQWFKYGIAESDAAAGLESAVLMNGGKVTKGKAWKRRDTRKG